MNSATKVRSPSKVGCSGSREGLDVRFGGLRVYFPLVSREWRNGVQLYLLLLPFLHSLLTKGKFRH